MVGFVQQGGVPAAANAGDGDSSYPSRQWAGLAGWKIRGLLTVLMFLVVYFFPALIAESRSLEKLNPSITIKQKKNISSISTLQVLGTKSSSASCRRQCQSRKNIIWLNIRPLTAGLNDRHFILNFFASWAGYLCATVYVPPPTSMLHPKHNGGKRVSTNLSWSDFKVSSFLDDNATALEIYPEPNEFPPNQIDSGSNTSWLKNWRMGSKEAEPFISQANQLINFVELQQEHDESTASTAFLWEIGTVPWDSFPIRNSSRFTGARPSELPSPTGPCEYVVDTIGETTRSLVDQIFDSIRQAHPTKSGGTVHFHIRRDDAIEECDTNLRRMHNYMMCSLRGEMTSAISSMFGNMTMLLASDERDPCYRKGIQQIVERGLGYGFVDLDATIQTVLNSHIARSGDDAHLDNNFYLYHLEKLVASDPRINIRLEQRRRNRCEDCEWDLGSIMNKNQVKGFDYSKAASLNLNLNLTLVEYRDCTRRSRMSSTKF